jgi:hypothetical protein
VDLAELKAGVADVEVTYRKQPFTVGYRPDCVTEDDLEFLSAFAEQSGVSLLRATIAPLERLVVRWSMTSDGAPLEVTSEAIASLPPRMRVAVLSAIMADFFSEGNETPSDAGSPGPAASEATVRSTPDSSGTRNGQASLPGPLPALSTPPAASSGGTG